MNEATGKALLGSSANLPGAASRLAFAKSTGTLSALDQRLRRNIGKAGISALTFEILDVLETDPGASAAAIAGDLEALERLWRETFHPSMLY